MFGQAARLGFTIAEVLITLGIIGIVAALTIPALVTGYQKNVTVESLKKVYSTLSQAVKLSEADNGFVSDWDIGFWWGYNIYSYMYSKLLHDNLY